MGLKVANNAVTTLAGPVDLTQTEITAAAGEGALFPALASGDWFPLVLIKQDGTREITRCTARAGDVFTVVRAQEGTGAQTFSVGDRLELRLTAAAIATGEARNLDPGEGSTDLVNNDRLTQVINERIDTTGNLGNAATKTVQNGNFDTTAGRVLMMGAFGLGAASRNAGTENLNGQQLGTFQFYAAGATNNPTGGDSAVVVWIAGTASNAAQIAVSVATGDMWTRGRLNNVWQSWTIFDSTPTGTVVWNASMTVPDGWYEMDGSEKDRTEDAALFAKIGTRFGAGNGSTTFNLPDARAEFIRGWDHGRGEDLGRVFGSNQDHQLEDHDHEFRYNQTPTTSDNPGIGAAMHHTSTSKQANNRVRGAINASVGDETRPRNLALMGIIKR